MLPQRCPIFHQILPMVYHATGRSYYIILIKIITFHFCFALNICFTGFYDVCVCVCVCVFLCVFPVRFWALFLSPTFPGDPHRDTTSRVFWSQDIEATVTCEDRTLTEFGLGKLIRYNIGVFNQMSWLIHLISCKFNLMEVRCFKLLYSIKCSHYEMCLSIPDRKVPST